MQLKKKQKGKAQAETELSKGTGKVGAIQPCLIASSKQIKMAALLEVSNSNNNGISEPLVEKNDTKAKLTNINCTVNASVTDRLKYLLESIFPTLRMQN